MNKNNNHDYDVGSVTSSDTSTEISKTKISASEITYKNNPDEDVYSSGRPIRTIIRASITHDQDDQE